MLGTIAAIRLLAVVGVALILGSCSAASVFEGEPQYAQEGLEIPGFQKLCDTKGGLHVYRTVEDAKGFVLLPERHHEDGPESPITDQGRGGCLYCLEYLARDGFDFVEADYVAPESRSIRNMSDYSRKSGRFRYALHPRSDGGCENYDFLVRFFPPVSRVAEEFAERIGDRCLVAEPIEAFSAQYEFGHDVFLVARESYQGEDGYVSQHRQFVRDRLSGEVLAEYNT